MGRERLVTSQEGAEREEEEDGPSAELQRFAIKPRRETSSIYCVHWNYTLIRHYLDTSAYRSLPFTSYAGEIDDHVQGARLRPAVDAQLAPRQ